MKKRKYLFGDLIPTILLIVGVALLNLESLISGTFIIVLSAIIFSKKHSWSTIIPGVVFFITLGFLVGIIDYEISRYSPESFLREGLMLLIMDILFFVISGFLFFYSLKKNKQSQRRT
jgi:hypothetical protein